MLKRPNVILITIDALRADRLGFMGHSKEVSPNLDSLAKEASVFRQAYSVGPTSPHSFPSMLTSTYPMDYNGPSEIKKPRELLSEILKEQGYATAAFHSTPFLADFLGYDRGWDLFEDVTPPFSLNQSGLGGGKTLISQKVKLKIKKLLSPLSGLKEFSQRTKRTIRLLFPELFFRVKYLDHRIRGGETDFKVKGDVINEKIKKFIGSGQKKKTPFFVWAHYMDAHWPYLTYNTFAKDAPFSYADIISVNFPKFLSPRRFKRASQRFLKKYLPLVLDLYDQGIRYADEKIGELINFLKEENLYQETIILVTADHGETFFEHGERGHPSELYNELLHVPLVIKIPGKQPDLIERRVSLIDLAPTVCGLLEVSIPPSFKGQSLFKERDGTVFHQTGISNKRVLVNRYIEIDQIDQCKIACQSGSWKYILNYKDNSEELYDLSQDSREQNDLSGSEKEKLLQMRQRVKNFEKENPPLAEVGN